MRNFSICLTHPLSLVKLKLHDGKVEVSGGGLNDAYSTIQLHFHWGDTEHHPGSEHKIDGQRYLMEVVLFGIHHRKHASSCFLNCALCDFSFDFTPFYSNLLQMHIVSMMKGLTMQQATEKSEGIAAMAFFIKVCPTR